MRAWLVIALACTACKDKAKHEPAAANGSGSATVEVKVDWDRCDKALAKAQVAPLDARPQLVLDGCHVCGGDWKPLLEWNLDPATGGPRREVIEQMLVACHAFCT